MKDAMLWLAFLIPLGLPPILAFRGKGFRGLWIAIIFIGLLVAWTGNAMYLDIKGVGGRKMIREGYSVDRIVAQALFWDFLTVPGITLAIGSFFAACFYRKKELSTKPKQ
jgi:hypothetical protein